MDLLEASIEYEMRRAVKRGAGLLDADYITEWRENILASALDMNNVIWCVLGQLFGTYGNGCAWFWSMVGEFEDPADWGFDTQCGWSYARLRELWIEEVQT